MDGKERTRLIRLGNECFNKGDYRQAATLFIKTQYRDGLTRIADQLFYDQRQPLLALKYYRMVNREDKVREIFERMAFALGRLMGREPAKKKEGMQDSRGPAAAKEIHVELPPLKVSPKLKILAEEILRDQEAMKQ